MLSFFCRAFSLSLSLSFLVIQFVLVSIYFLVGFQKFLKCQVFFQNAFWKTFFHWSFNWKSYFLFFSMCLLAGLFVPCLFILKLLVLNGFWRISYKLSRLYLFRLSPSSVFHLCFIQKLNFLETPHNSEGSFEQRIASTLGVCQFVGNQFLYFILGGTMSTWVCLLYLRCAGLACDCIYQS